MKRYAAFAACLGMAAFTTTAMGAVTLGNTVRTGGELHFTVTGESNAIYIVEGSTNLQQWQPVNTNREFAVARTVSVNVSNSRSYYRARVARPFTAALVARSTISLDGNGIRIDSYDSANPYYSTPDGRYDPSKFNDRGDVTVYSALTNSLILGNAKIFGTVAIGPGGSTILGPSGCVGSIIYVLDPNNAGTIQPGRLREETGSFFPDAIPPSLGLIVPPPGNVGGINYDYVLGDGDYGLASLSLSGGRKMIVIGRAMLHVSGNFSVSGSGQITVARTASLRLYVGGPSAAIGGVVNQNFSPLGFQYYGLPGNTNVTLAGNGAFVGVIYAPRAEVSMGTGGNDAIDFLGAIVANTVRVIGHYNVHYDENLARSGPLF